MWATRIVHFTSTDGVWEEFGFSRLRFFLRRRHEIIRAKNNRGVDLPGNIVLSMLSSDAQDRNEQSWWRWADKRCKIARFALASNVSVYS